MNNNRFILEPYKGMNTRHHCPGCNSKDKTFSLYIDTESGTHVHPTVGRCNRVDKCGYHVTPKQYFQDNNISFDMTQSTVRPIPPPCEASFIDSELFKKTLQNYESNNFVKYLLSIFDEETTAGLIQKYYIGTSKHWPGATIFWQIDTHGKVRTGKIMQYDEITGHRIKEPFSHIDWVHKVIKQPDFELKQCLFGEYLLSDKIKPVAIAESEKTAIIASVYLPGVIWLSVGGADGLSFERLSVLKNRKVILFPDLKQFDKWTIKAKDFNDRMIGTRFFVSDYLETNASEAERAEGADIADYLVKFDAKSFKESRTPSTVEQLPAVKQIVCFDIPAAVREEPVNWFDGHLFRSMEQHEICDQINFFN